MTDFVRQDKPKEASELTMLNAFLDFHRATLLQKVAGVSEEDGRRSPLAEMSPHFATEYPLTLFNLLKHIAYVERSWFQIVFAGLTDTPDPGKDDPNFDFVLDDTETGPELIAFYQAEIAKSQSLVKERVAETGSEQAALESHAKHPEATKFTLRWIMLHMIEETARHNGHADFLRQAIDGVTGE